MVARSQKSAMGEVTRGSDRPRGATDVSVAAVVSERLRAPVRPPAARLCVRPGSTGSRTCTPRRSGHAVKHLDDLPDQQMRAHGRYTKIKGQKQ